jgi:hypothetical protein
MFLFFICQVQRLQFLVLKMIKILCSKVVVNSLIVNETKYYDLISLNDVLINAIFCLACLLLSKIGYIKGTLQSLRKTVGVQCSERVCQK